MPAIPDTKYQYLLKVNRFEALTPRQLMRLLGYSPNAYTTVTDRLKRMAEQELVVIDAKIQDDTKKISGAFHLYGIGREGKKILEANNIVVARKNTTRQAEYWRHTMAVTDVLIETVVWVEQHPEYEIVSMYTEYDIQRAKLTEPILVTLQTGERVRVEPDAIVELNTGRTIIFEIERGQADNRAYSQQRWTEKIEKLVAFWEAEPERETISFVVIAMRGEAQAQTLRKWTEAFFQEQRKDYLSGHFLITHTFDPSQLLK